MSSHGSPTNSNNRDDFLLLLKFRPTWIRYFNFNLHTFYAFVYDFFLLLFTFCSINALRRYWKKKLWERYEVQWQMTQQIWLMSSPAPHFHSLTMACRLSTHTHTTAIACINAWRIVVTHTGGWIFNAAALHLFATDFNHTLAFIWKMHSASQWWRLVEIEWLLFAIHVTT